jgi:hypothetical protein
MEVVVESNGVRALKCERHTEPDRIRRSALAKPGAERLEHERRTAEFQATPAEFAFRIPAGCDARIQAVNVKPKRRRHIGNAKKRHDFGDVGFVFRCSGHVLDLPQDAGRSYHSIRRGEAASIIRTIRR